MKWKTLFSEYLFNDRWFKVRRDRCETPGGKIVDPYYVYEFPTWVGAVPVTEDGKVVMVRQYRHALGETIIEIPDVKPSIKASAYCNLGVLHQGEELELEYYRQSLKHQPKTFAATYSLASALASRKQWSEAIALFRQAIVDLNEGDDNINSSTATTRRQNRRQALQSLYTATMQCIKEQQDVSPTITSREGMMQQFQEIMGVENFQELQSLAK